MKKTIRLALTGGPSSGKTTVLSILEKTFGEDIIGVPETATLLYSGGFKRFSDPVSQKIQQKTIYQVQCNHEELISKKYPSRLMICDRGTLDGLAYWPGSSADYFQTIESSMLEEFGRYDAVIYLEPAKAVAYDRANNRMRIESYPEALDLAKKTLAAWSQHPNFLPIESQQSFESKIEAVLQKVHGFLDK